MKIVNSIIITIIYIYLVFAALVMSAATDQRVIELSKASILQSAGKPTEALTILDNYFENPVTEDSNIWTARAYYLRGCCLWDLGDKNNAVSEMGKGADILISIDKEICHTIPDFTDVVLGASAFACNLDDYQKCIYYGEHYHNILKDLINYNEFYQKQFMTNLMILAKCYDKIGNSVKIFEYTKYFNQIRCLSDENLKEFFKLIVVFADAAYKNSVWDAAIPLYNLSLMLINQKFGESDQMTYLVKVKLATAFNKIGKMNEAIEILEDLMPVAILSNDVDFKLSVILEYVAALSSNGDKVKALKILNSHLSELEKSCNEEESLYNIHFILYTLQKSNGLEEEASATYNNHLQKLPQTNLMYEHLNIMKMLESGKHDIARRSIDNYKKIVEEVGDTLSPDYERYLNLELMYSIINQQSINPQIADRYYYCLMHNNGPYDVHTFSGVCTLVANSFIADDDSQFKKYLSISVGLAQQIISHRFLGMDNARREQFWKELKLDLAETIPRLIFVKNEEECNWIGYQMALMTKGLLLRSELSISDILSADNANLSYMNGLNDLLDQVDNLKKSDLDATQAEQEALNLMEQLKNESPLYSKLQSKLQVSALSVASVLKPEDMAVEFIWINDGANGHVLGAYLLRKDWKSPKIKIFIDGENLDKLIKHNLIYNKNILSTIIWGGLKEYADGVRNIYFSPDGPLHNIALESMSDFECDDKLISERWNIFRLSSTGELVTHQEKDLAKSATLFGGMIYDAEEEDITQDFMDKTLHNHSMVNMKLSKADLIELNLSDGVKYLPGTLQEVNNIYELFSEYSASCDLFTGNKASENNFIKLDGNYTSIVHIATHGYYWKKDVQANQSMADSIISEEEMALKRSGLLFSGANRALSGIKSSINSYDGILTALEISHSNLNNVDFVVMSACKTGLGDVDSDGVFGLQRGFKKAGVNSILMSLWEVDDDATQLLMTKFYENYLSGLSKKEALLNAQRFVREYKVGEDGIIEYHGKRSTQNRGAIIDTATDTRYIPNTRPFSDPQYWAAWILLDALD